MIKYARFSSFDQVKKDLLFLETGESYALLYKNIFINREEDKKIFFSEFSKIIGKPRQYPGSIYGSEIIHFLNIPSPSLVTDGIDWHTEDSFSIIPPTFVVLLCIHGSPDVRTHLSKLDGPRIEKKNTVWVKSDPFLYAEKLTEIRNVAFPSRFGIGWRYDPALITPNLDCFKGEKFVHRLDDNSLVLEAGDFLIFNNHLLTHAKSGYDRTCKRRLIRMIID